MSFHSISITRNFGTTKLTLHHLSVFSEYNLRCSLCDIYTSTVCAPGQLLKNGDFIQFKICNTGTPELSVCWLQLAWGIKYQDEHLFSVLLKQIKDIGWVNFELLQHPCPMFSLFVCIIVDAILSFYLFIYRYHWRYIKCNHSFCFYVKHPTFLF